MRYVSTRCPPNKTPHFRAAARSVASTASAVRSSPMMSGGQAIIGTSWMMRYLPVPDTRGADVGR